MLVRDEEVLANAPALAGDAGDGSVVSGGDRHAIAQSVAFGL